MGWRKTGVFHAPQEVLVLTCDVCERDLGHEDERRPQAHFRISHFPNRGAIDNQDPAHIVCSIECLRAFAARMSGPEPVPLRPSTPPHGGPRR